MEMWKVIDGTDGKYEVSNLGYVRSWKSGNPRILKPCSNGRGYLQVDLHIEGKRNPRYIHRLVAQTFIPNPDNKREINHINGNKTDNRVENLEWVSRSENVRHSVDIDLMPQGGTHYKASLTNEQARYVRDNPDGLSIKELASKLGVRKSIISAVQTGERYHNAGGNIRSKIDMRVPDDVRDVIRRLYVRGSSEFGSTALARKFSVSHGTILSIVHETD